LPVVDGFSSLMLGFNPRTIHVEAALYTVALGQSFFRVLIFPLSVVISSVPPS